MDFEKPIHLEELDSDEISTPPTPDLNRKVDRRILPFVALTYLLCYLDRSNIGNAKVLNSDASDDLMHSIGMTDQQYRVALMLFLVAYSIFEAPSNLAMKIFSPPVWLGFLVASFGALCAGIGGSKNVQTLMALRFLLGAAEAGTFPGMIFYLSFWYGPRERAIRIAVFLCSATLAGAFGGAIAYGVGHMNQVGGLNAWRWLFILEGLPCILVAIAIFFFLPSYPENAKWLTDEEKEILRSSFGENIPRGEDKLSWQDAKETLQEPRLWLHYLTYLCMGIGVSSLSLFAPTIVEGIGYTGLTAQLFTIPPYACAYVVTLCAAYASDRYMCRGLIAAGFCLLGVITFLIPACVSTPSLHLRYAMLVLCTCSVFGSLPSLCAWVSDNVRTTTAGSIASGLNVAFSGPGQIIGVWIYESQQAPRYQLGHAVNAASQFVGMVLALGLWLHYRRLNSRLGPGETRWIA
ncbi:uncharacterized protein N7483_003801 [Penicillium malachiteum]|uniref:uncharacterized protein n=1 Tax=Penicillium malachiteum TaxID=1324776 RepID=UPI0025472D5C|nr:uncharacterized protein N7483_003801 [Penicillium malachiteum]KAJ5729293.1 hypothetical protein N7483_003801 [Penicillium malachiteum]